MEFAMFMLIKMQIWSIAKSVVFNSKMRRPEICGAAETLLIDKAISKNAMNLLADLLDSKCEIRGDDLYTIFK